jgi:hypothetical protein
MSFTAHLAVAAVISVAAISIAIPVILEAGSERAVPTDKLTVPVDAARPALLTADRAMGPIVQKFAGLPEGNPFAMREKGVRANLPVPEPPPPPLALPEPPPTPFAAGR